MDEQSIFFEALDRSTLKEQNAWLDEACDGDESLKQRILSMLAKHKDAENFLEQPVAGLDATFLKDFSAKEIAASLNAGSAPAFDNDAAVVIGNAGHSVLQSLGQTIDVPKVILHEPLVECDDPITRPTSNEMPERESDSRYRIDGEIARGGMGAILKGRDTDLGRDLAIKVLLDSHKQKPELIHRFVEEAQIGGQLQHPGIAPVYELGQFSDQRPFFSMKLVKGETLSKLLAARKEPNVDRGRFLNLFEQVCQTMAYAHSRGVIHRDLKPSNIMVGAFGEVQVMDWGLAKVLSTGGVADEKTSQQKHQARSIIQTHRSAGSDTPGSIGIVGSETQMGSVMGTPAYMPPEQALGEIDQLDQRTDVFSLGAILCEILTGQPPYVADDGNQVFRMASRGKLDECMSRLDSCDADPDLIAVTKKCLELEPIDRYCDGGELAKELTDYLESVESKLRETELQRAADLARGIEEKKRRRMAFALATAIFLIVGMLGAFWMNQRQAATARVSNALIEAQKRASQANSVAMEGNDPGKLALVEEAIPFLEKATEENSVGAELKQAVAKALADLQDKTRNLEQRIQAQEFKTSLDAVWVNVTERPDVLNDDRIDWAAIAQNYEIVFDEHLGLTTVTLAEAIDSINGSPIKETLIAGLESWAGALSKAEAQKGDAVVSANATTMSTISENVSPEMLYGIADAVDPEQSGLRRILLDRDLEQLKELAVDRERLKRLSPNSFAFLGHALFDKKERELAFNVWREGVARYPQDYLLTVTLSNGLTEESNVAEAVQYARSAVAIRPKSVWARVTLFGLLKDMEKKEEALMHIAVALERHRESDEVLKVSGLIRSMLGEHDSAIAIASELVQRSRDAEPVDQMQYRSILATIFQAKGEYERASEELKIAIGIANEIERNRKTLIAENKTFFVYYSKGLLDFQTCSLEQAKMAFEEASRRAPPQYKMAMRTLLSNVLVHQNDIDGAIKLFESAKADQSFSSSNEFHLGLLYAWNGDYKKASELMESNWKPDSFHLSSRAWAFGASAHHDVEHDVSIEDCVNWAKTAIDISTGGDEDAIDHLNTYGVVLYRAGGESNLRKAVEALSQSEKIYESLTQKTALHNLQHTMNLLFIAMAKWKLNQKEEAREYYQQAMKLRPSCQWSKLRYMTEFFNESAALFEEE